MIALLLALLTPSSPQPLAHDGGVCAGLAWVKLTAREQGERERGPDFDVFRFHGPAGDEDHWWAVYSGRFANAKAEGQPLITRNGVSVHRAVRDGKFVGYLAVKGGAQNHFFGSFFADKTEDLAFFDRIAFGEAGQVLCHKV